jgi:hypothetical protein
LQEDAGGLPQLPQFGGEVSEDAQPAAHPAQQAVIPPFPSNGPKQEDEKAQNDNIY